MLDKLKRLFIIEEDDAKNENQDSIIGSKKEQVTNKSKANNGAIMSDLLAILSEKNLAGFDYLEYKNAISSLEAMDMNEATRYKSAFVTAKSLGVTVPKLIDSIGYYQKILQEEYENFVKSVKENRTSNVSIAEKKDYLKLITKKEQQIVQLNSEIADLEGKIYGRNAKGHSSADFEKATNRMIQEMRADIKKIKKYLG